MEISNEQKVTIIGLAIAIGIGSIVYLYNHVITPAKPSVILDKPAEVISHKSSANVVVHVCGAVKREGVYKLNASDKVIDAIKMAGGAGNYADLSGINLAEGVKDGQKIVVPVKAGNQDIRVSGDLVKRKIGNQGSMGSLINLNTASENELDSLPGVGPATAKKIVEARPFSSIDDLKKIPRFSKNKIEKLKDKVCL